MPGSRILFGTREEFTRVCAPKVTHATGLKGAVWHQARACFFWRAPNATAGQAPPVQAVSSAPTAGPASICRVSACYSHESAGPTLSASIRVIPEPMIHSLAADTGVSPARTSGT